MAETAIIVIKRAPTMWVGLLEGESIEAPQFIDLIIFNLKYVLGLESGYSAIV